MSHIVKKEWHIEDSGFSEKRKAQNAKLKINSSLCHSRESGNLELEYKAE
ncbi:hypothetical protein ES705_39295 [subsurface metagenome]